MDRYPYIRIKRITGAYDSIKRAWVQNDSAGYQATICLGPYYQIPVKRHFDTLEAAQAYKESRPQSDLRKLYSSR